MSLKGRARVAGSRVTLARPTGGRATDGSGTVTSWAAVATDVPAALESLTDELVQKIYGADRTVKDRALIPDLTLVVRPGDALIVTAGKRNGAKYRIEDARLNDSRVNGHWDAALVSTDETITITP